MWILLSVALGFLLDLCFGDPVWLPHPVVLIGKSISRLEKFLRQKFPQTPAGETKAGVILAVCIPLCSLLLSGGILLLAYHISFWLWFVLHTFWSYQILAARCLEQESRKVYRFLAAGDLSGARTQLSYLVGRETSQLSAEEVTKACVETVAENTSDGVIAPLFYMFFFGAAGGFIYKAVNTMDSMIGYKNDKYLYFGRFAAKLDDVLNFIPSRIGGVLMVLSAGIASLAERSSEKHYSMKNAWKIFLRDRKKHSSPNSAQTEAACAGALMVALSGDNYYFGKLVKKPQIGDAVRPLEAEDIKRSHVLLYISAFLMVAAVLGLRVVFFLMI